MAIPHDSYSKPTTQVIRPATTTLNPNVQNNRLGMGSSPVLATTLHPNVQGGNLGAPAPKAKPRPLVSGGAQQPAPAAPAAAAATQGSPYDYSSDPVLQAIRAGGIKQRADAEAAALSGRKQLAIQLGDATGIVDDAGTAQAAKGNSFSTLQEIMRGYGRDQTATNEAENKANLFYSGHRATELGKLLENRNRSEYQARGAAQDQLTGINQTLAQTLQDVALRDAQAQSEAQQRALQQALTYGIDPGVGGAFNTNEAPLAGSPQAQDSIAGTASPTQQLDPWLLALLSGRT